MKEGIKQAARYLRKNSTSTERKLWKLLRNRNLGGRKFYRQYIIQFEYNGCKRFFIADFYCYEKRLILEVDGKIHDNQKEYDELRSLIINELGIKVIRITNSEIDSNFDYVFEKIREFL